MIPKYVPILRAKKSEFEAMEHTSRNLQQKILPLFEIPNFSKKTAEQARFKNTPNPKECFLDGIIDQLVDSRNQESIMFDIFRWASDSQVENGEHVLNYCVNRLTQMKASVIPTIGYDRWEDMDYSNALSNIPSSVTSFCLRLEQYAFEDMIEPEHFLSNIDSIVNTLNLDTKACSIVLDFGDVTKSSVLDIQEHVSRALDLLSVYKFKFISIAGCSLSTIINDMVPKEDSIATIMRREMYVWQMCKEYDNTSNLVFGDYGVVNPSAKDDIIAPDANGKIRYTVERNYFVVRGHSRRKGNKGEQMWELSEKVLNSDRYMGLNFSWGDERIYNCSNKEFKGNGGQWVAIDTNHHTHTVLAEIYEYEKVLVNKKLVPVSDS